MSITKKALERGHLLSEEAYEILQESPELIDEASTDSLVLRKADLVEEKREWRFLVEYEQERGENENSITDLVEYYNHRLKTLKPDIEKRIKDSSLVSINNPGSEKTITVIGIVNEVNENGFVIDDGTGDVQVLTEQKLSEDIVVGVKGRMTTGNLTAEEILFPDIPIKDVSKCDGEIAFFEGGNYKEVNAQVIVIDSPTEEEINKLKKSDSDVIVINSDAKGDNIFNLSIPARIEIGKVSILIGASPNLTQENSITLLRSRHLNPGEVIRNDPLLLDEIPDIALISSPSDVFLNYKGVTVLSPSETSYLIDLSTREVKEL